MRASRAHRKASAAELRGARMRPARMLLGGLALVLLCAGPTGAADPEIRVELQPAAVEVGGVALLQVQLEGISGGAKPEIPPVAGLDVYDSGRSTNFSLVNGRFSRSTIYTYQLVARRAGDYTIGPIRVTDDGRAYESQPLTLRVAARAAPAAGGVAEPPAADGSEGAAGEEIFARVVVDREEVYRGQQVILRFQLFRREDVPIVGTRAFTPPATPGFWREDLGPEQHRRVTIEGQTYVVTELAWALFPTREGELIIEPAGIVCYVEVRPSGSRRDLFSDFFDRDFFSHSLRDQRPIELRTDPVRLQVRPLPTAGRLTGFTGSVGDYGVTAALDAERGRVGEPLALTVAVRGEGHIQAIGPPVWPEWDGLRVFDSGDAVSLEKRGDRVFGEKQFTQVLVPTREGELRIPPVEFVFFDPAAERYRRLETDPLMITVGPMQAAREGISPDGRPAAGVGDELLYLRTDLAETLRPLRRGGLRVAWLVHLLPLLALGTASVVRRRRALLDSDPALARRARARRRALAELRAIDARSAPGTVARGLAEMLESYLGAWLGRPGRGLPRNEVAGRLQEAGVAPGLTERVTALLDWTDEVRFAAATGSDAAARRAEAHRLLDGLEHALRRTAHGRRL